LPEASLAESPLPPRDHAWALVCEYTQSESLRRHMLAVEIAMRAYAQKSAANEDLWGIVGLLHDFDYERWPNPPDHPLQGAKILTEQGYPEAVIYAICSHADYLSEYPRKSPLDKTLYACDELSGFIVAVAQVRPEGLQGMSASSVKKKLKNKAFAAAVNRDDITRGAADLGVELDEHILFVANSLAANAQALGLQ
jgi:putative nucleotidyltransferase with HDIG domain